MKHYLKPNTATLEKDDCLHTEIANYTKEISANAYYFNNEEWANEYFEHCHRTDSFKERWETAVGSLDGKTVVDIGCGPGNIFATLGGKPKELIGVDVSIGSLGMAGKLGYATLLADAHDLPFQSGFADIVVLNATLHHCKDMRKVLEESARLVKPGGLLVTDHDPQLTSMNFRGPGKFLWNSRVYLYRVFGKGFHKSRRQQYWALKSEVHHRAGDGVSATFFKDTLHSMGFNVHIFAHNNESGAEVFQGKKGNPNLKFTVAQLLSGQNPFASKSALSLMCVAQKEIGESD